MGDLALHVPGLVVLEAPGVALEQQRRRPRGFDLLGDRQLSGDHLAGQPVLLTLEHQAGTRLVDEGGLAEQPRVLLDLGPPATRHQDDLHVGSQAGLDRTHAVERDRSLAVVKQRGSPPEQGSVEVQVEAARRAGRAHGTLSEASAGRSSGAPSRSASGWGSQASFLLQAPGDRGEDRLGHPRQSRQGLVGVAVLVEIHLGDPVSPTARQTSISIAISTP